MSQGIGTFETVKPVDPTGKPIETSGEIGRIELGVRDRELIDSITLLRSAILDIHKLLLTIISETQG
jgi:hypothetical protein